MSTKSTHRFWGPIHNAAIALRAPPGKRPSNCGHGRARVAARAWDQGRRLLLAVLFSAFCLAYARAADNCPTCQVSKAKRDQYNAQLNLTLAQQKKAESRHLLYGLPAAAAAPAHEHMLHQQDYLTWYDDDLRVPLWVAYRLAKKTVNSPRERLDCFRPDPRLAAHASAACADYDEPVFDQGHLAPNADFTATEAMMINTYVYSNMTPQQKNFNEHTWERLEALVRMWCKKRGDLFVITGALFDQDGNGARDPDGTAQRVQPGNRVAIPTHFYKIILKKKAFAAADSIAILLPHDNDKHNGDDWVIYVSSHITTIGDIERVAGVNFLPKLSASKRAALESYKASALWPKE
jgi:endonuclease G